MKSKYQLNSILATLFIVMLITMINNACSQNISINLVIYLIEILLIGYLFFINIKSLSNLIYSSPIIFFGSLILIVNIILSPYGGEPVRLLKFFGYILIAIYGYNLGKRTVFEPNRILVNLITFVPLFIVAVLDHTAIKNMFFPNSNNFVFWGIVVSLLYYSANQHRRDNHIFYKSILIFLLYILVGSSVGVIVAFILSVFYLNRRNLKLIFISVVTILFLGVFAAYSDIAVFVRLRNATEVFTIIDWKSIGDIESFLNINLYELNNNISTIEGQRNDHTSALWRLQQWVTILCSYFKNWWYAIPVGLGDNFTTKSTGLPPHNDFLRVLCEYGILVFGAVMAYITKALHCIRREYVAYFLFAIFFYHLTENLIDTFPTCCIYYLILSYSYSRVKNNNKQYANPAS